MPTKLKYEYVYNCFKEQGCELLESEYVGIEHLMKYKCKCGNHTKIDLKRFKKGVQCLRCVGKEPPTFEMVFNKFKEDGRLLLETEYINSKTPMEYICACGNKSTITWAHFNHDKSTCKKCKNLEKYKYEDVKNYIESFGYKLLSTEYITARIGLEIQCPADHTYNTSFGNFKTNKSRCRKCYEISNSGEHNKRWNPDRTRTRRLDLLKFDLNKISILENDQNYYEYLIDNTKYNIDHIFPRKAFIDNDLDKVYDVSLIQKICNSPDNLRILPKKENLKKGSKYIQEDFIKWFNLKILEENNFVFD